MKFKDVYKNYGRPITETESKFEKFKRMEFNLTPEVKKLFSEQEGKYMHAEVVRRLEWEWGEEWLNAREDEEVTEIIIKKSKEVANAYFERKQRDRLVDKLAELIYEKFGDKKKQKKE